MSAPETEIYEISEEDVDLMDDDELREYLAKNNLDTNGKKKELVERFKLFLHRHVPVFEKVQTHFSALPKKEREHVHCTGNEALLSAASQLARQKLSKSFSSVKNASSRPRIRSPIIGNDF